MIDAENETRFWCPWCGETACGSNREDRVQCMRCVAEFMRLFRFWPEAAMLPLAEGEEPGEPEAAKKRFEFRDPDGRLLGETWSPSDEDHNVNARRESR